MSAAAASPGLLLPQPPGGQRAGAVLALAAHAGLLAALTVSVDWRAQPPEVVSAELWASVPQTAAPRAEAAAPPAPVAAVVPAPRPALPPPPPPRPAPAPAPAPRIDVRPPPPPAPAPPDIALEREQRRRALQDSKPRTTPAPQPPPPPPPPVRAERRPQPTNAPPPVPAPAPAPAPRAADRPAPDSKADDGTLARLREDNLRRMMGQAAQVGAPGSSDTDSSRGSAAQSAGPSAAYAGIVAKVIRDQSVFTGSVPGNPAAEVEVRSGPGGTIVSRRLVKSSGVKAWDDAVLQAIDKVGRLPPDEKGRVPPQMLIAFRPNA